MKTLFTVGSLLPAVGIAILLKQVATKPVDILVFVFGFTLAACMGLNLIAASIVGGFFAVINYRIKILALQKPLPQLHLLPQRNLTTMRRRSDMAEKKLSKKALNKSFRNWFYGHLTCFSQEHMQTFGYLCAMLPLVEELYDTKEEQTEASRLIPHSSTPSRSSAPLSSA